MDMIAAIYIYEKQIIIKKHIYIYIYKKRRQQRGEEAAIYIC